MDMTLFTGHKHIMIKSDGESSIAQGFKKKHNQSKLKKAIVSGWACHSWVGRA